MEKYKDTKDAEPVIKIATQALDNFLTTNKTTVKKEEPIEEPIETKEHNVRHTVLETTSTNPLMQYHRPPGVYVVLPSMGNFYTNKPALSSLNEVLVRPMTGESLIEVVKSCVPGIENPDEIPGPDFSVLMLAIRLATYGKDMPIVQGVLTVLVQPNLM